jgi:hypothetical protein
MRSGLWVICDRSLMLGRFAIGFMGGELRSQFDVEIYAIAFIGDESAIAV